MSFSQKVKNEILKVRRDTDALFCMLCGEILSAGSLIIKKNNISFSISSENEEFATAIVKQLEICFQVLKSDISIKTMQGAMKNKFELTIDSEVGMKVLEGLGILSRDKMGQVQINRTIDPNLATDLDCKKSYLAGAFCGSGSISAPNTENDDGHKVSGYHMEWVCLTEQRAETICQFLAELNIISKKIERNSSFVVYLKESEAICQVLAQLGAVACMLELESNKVERSVRNNINRQSNCASANLDKVMFASVKQMQAIDIISSTIGIENLPKPLADVALARLANPDASYAEIAQVLGGNISRVAVSQRFLKLIKIAQELGEEENG